MIMTWYPRYRLRKQRITEQNEKARKLAMAEFEDMDFTDPMKRDEPESNSESESLNLEK